LQDELVPGLRSKSKRYEDSWSSNLTVIQKGRKTTLYEKNYWHLSI
jgi:hypothetical protein